MRQFESDSAADESPKTVNRRGALKAVAATGAGIVGIGELTGRTEAMKTALDSGGGGGSPVYSQQDSFKEQTSMFGDSYIKTHLGSGLEVVDSDPPGGDDYWQYDFRIAGNGTLMNQDDELAERGTIRKQGATVKEETPTKTSLFDSNDPREIGMQPTPDDISTEGAFGATTGALSLAAAALNAPAASTAFTAAGLANSMSGLVLRTDQQQNTHDWQAIHSGGYDRGGHHVRFIVREYSSPAEFEVRSRFGPAEVGWKVELNEGVESVTEI
jgi:hypothetical protein